MPAQTYLRKKMRIVFFTQLDEIHSSIVLDAIVREGYDVAAVVTSETLMHKKGFLSSIRSVIRKSGFRYFLMRALEGVYIKHYPFFKRIGLDRFRKHSPSQVKEIIQRHRLRHLSFKDVNSPAAREQIKALEPAVCVSCVFNQIFSRETIAIPRNTFVNIHRSYLPEYRGVSPTFWVLADGASEAGVTIHEVNEKIDAGDILARKRIPIRRHDTVNTLSFRLMREAASLLLGILDEIGRGENLKRIPIDPSASYRGWPTREATRRFIRNGRRVF